MTSCQRWQGARRRMQRMKYFCIRWMKLRLWFHSICILLLFELPFPLCFMKRGGRGFLASLNARHVFLSLLSLVDWLLGALLFSGWTCPCHSAGTQHRIQTDTKPSRGESGSALPPPLLSVALLYPPPSGSTTCLPFLLSFSISSFCIWYHSHSFFPPLIYCPRFLSACLRLCFT